MKLPPERREAIWNAMARAARGFNPPLHPEDRRTVIDFLIERYRADGIYSKSVRIAD